MAYNILGINPFHNGSVCVLSDGKVVYYLEEERLTRKKHDANPFKTIYEALNKYPIDEVVIAGIDKHEVELPYSKENPFSALIRKFSLKNYPFTVYSNHHHATHIFHSFFNSGFKDAIGIIIDSGGSQYSNYLTEMNTIYDIFKDNNNSLTIETSKTLSPYNYSLNHNLDSTPLNIAAFYSVFTNFLGFKIGEEGKTMGLSSYGKINPLIPPIFNLDKGISNPNYCNETVTEDQRRSIFINHTHFSHLNFSPSTQLDLENKNFKKLKFTQDEKDLCFYLQTTLEKYLKNLINSIIKNTNKKNIVCSGGLFLNCVANYYLTKEFPDINFYFEPVSHDGGTAIGAAYWKWKELNPKFKSNTLKSLYLGPQYSKEQLLEGIKKYI